MERLWFKRKTYGWGWQPSSVEGWIITFLYFIIVIYLGISLNLENSQNVVLDFVLPVFLLSLLFILIAYQCGESPRWQWGKRKD